MTVNIGDNAMDKIVTGEAYLQNTVEGRLQSQASDIIPGNDYLRCISTGEKVIIPACDGSEIIAESSVIGWKGIGSQGQDVNERGVATPEVKVALSEIIETTEMTDMIKRTTIGEILGLNVVNVHNPKVIDVQKLRQMTLTQHQIIKFCVHNRNWLRACEGKTLALFESYEYFFVAAIIFSPRINSFYSRLYHIWEDYPACGVNGEYNQIILQELI